MASHWLLASWQRRAVMAPAPATVHLMPDNFRRWPMTALHPASTGPSNCASDCLVLSSFHVPGHGGPGSERGLGLGREGGGDRASGPLVMREQAGPQPVVNGARPDAQPGGRLADARPATSEGRRTSPAPG